MFNKGLSLAQAPNISVPFRFFLSAPLFGIIIGLVIIFSPYELVTNQYSNTAITLVHLFTLGILAMIIFGAMQQMMPVLAGAIIPKSSLFASIVHISLILGTLSFCIAFLFEIKLLLPFAGIFLTISFFAFFLIAIKLLFKVEYITSTVNAMKLFSLAGFIAVILGLYLIYGHISNDIGSKHYLFLNAHMIFALLGFAVLLIMGVSFQIIPMFYVSPDFPKFLQNKFPLIIFILLIVFSIFTIFEINILALKIILSSLFIIFSFYALYSLSNRRRPVFDVTLWYWKLSLVMFILSMLIWLFIPSYSSYLLAVIFAFGFLYALLQGMVYKIIPFLAWFHLSSKGHFKIPTMREMIIEKHIRIHFYFFVSSLFCFILAAFFKDIFLHLAAILFIISNLYFFINCLGAIKKYSIIAKKDPMDLSNFS
ncbi:MAG: hypothetical protein HRT40_05380 [Campylobacteraceae bacterium]|nr:hypothetical protein [Campylobacteraceae bacterium]